MHQDNPSMVLNRYQTIQREKNGTETVMHQDNPSMVLNRYHTMHRKKTALRPLCIKIIPQWC